MSTIPLDPAPADLAAPAAHADAAAPAKRVRRQGGHCGNCGFEDTGHYCSRCGEPLHGTTDTVLQILWADLVEGPVHNGFALAKTTWLMLWRPRRFFDGVLRRQHGMTHVPFFLAPVWRRVSHKPHGVPNAVKYFVLIYTLTVLGAWAVGVNVFPPIPIPFRPGAVLPGAFAEPLFLVFVVFAAAMYSKAVSMLLGGRIETELLTRFMLYLNGFALIPFVGMAMTGTRHPWGFLASLAFWLYALFALPQLSLPRIFGVSRTRLGFAQAGAAVANVLLFVVMIFCAGIALDLLAPNWNQRAAATSATPRVFDPAESGLSAVRRAAASNVFPMDTVATILQLPAPNAPPPKGE
ncbi:hypothetical protein [Longimicrobium sp.]|uniref:hypothetical protein n=1 Tax=Longimicrobium sp. TaxID=2029185 RepID=UPI002C0529C8|nr:hypothetical protein [Longimicrobium sp.]HSU16179.1 hypothetical protein [Longimicrobium sp.]